MQKCLEHCKAVMNKKEIDKLSTSQVQRCALIIERSSHPFPNNNPSPQNGYPTP